MNIPEMRLKIKRAVGLIESREVYTMLLVIFVGFSSFGLGRLSKLRESHVPVRIEQAVLASPQTASAVSAVPPAALYPSKEQQGNSPASVAAGGQLVASKNGTKYHYPWCSGAQRISEVNKIIFNSIEEARKAGYTPASNCKGLK